MQKTITLRTNYNNKLACSCFAHIDLAPAAGIPESTLNTTVFEIRTSDNSHPPVKAKLINLIRVPLWKVCDALSYPSHGMDSLSFQEWMLQNNNVDFEKQMAVYYYQRIEQ